MGITFDRSGVASQLARLSSSRIAAFLAACVERRKPATQALRGQGRAGDLAIFEETLEDLWSLASGRLVLEDGVWDRIDEFSEITSEEEAEGELVFAEDAIVALWYATKFLRSGDTDHVLDCASRCVDSADFWDDETGRSENFGDAEIRIQLQDLEELQQSKESDYVVAARLRERAVAEATRAFPPRE
jgi:hypothetical protein